MSDVFLFSCHLEAYGTFTLVYLFFLCHRIPAYVVFKLPSKGRANWMQNELKRRTRIHQEGTSKVGTERGL